MVYIQRHQLLKLREYKYSGVDHSLVSRYILKPFYTNFVIHCFPMSIAPNAITLSGFGFVIVNFLTLLWYNPTLDRDCPPWVYVTWSIGLFLYQTFDAVDGQQARRTGQSGPLGELFDHGVDALNTVLEVLIFAGATNLGQGWKTIATLLASLFTFYVQTWDEYHTHTLTLGLVSGPVEGIMTLYTVYALTAVLGGASFWQRSMLESLGVQQHGSIPSILYDLAWNEWYMVYGGLVLVFNTYQSVINVVAARRGRHQDAVGAVFGLLPFAALTALLTTYLACQPTILHHNLVSLSLFVGLVNAYSVGQIIVAHLVKSPFPSFNVLIALLLFAAIDAAGPVLNIQTSGAVGWPSAIDVAIGQVPYLWLCLGLAVGVYGSFVVDVIVAICEEMDIWCLTIKHPQPQEKKKN